MHLYIIDHNKEGEPFLKWHFGIIAHSPIPRKAYPYFPRDCDYYLSNKYLYNVGLEAQQNQLQACYRITQNSKRITREQAMNFLDLHKMLEIYKGA